MSKVIFEKSKASNVGEELTNKLPGMAAEIEKAKQKKMKIRYFMEDCMEVK